MLQWVLTHMMISYTSKILKQCKVWMRFLGCNARLICVFVMLTLAMCATRLIGISSVSPPSRRFLNLQKIFTIIISHKRIKL